MSRSASSTCDGTNVGSERKEFGLEAASGELMADLLCVNRVHDDDGVGAESGECIRALDLPAAAGQEFAVFVGVDVDDRLQCVAQFHRAHERYALRSRAPDRDFLALAAP